MIVDLKNKLPEELANLTPEDFAFVQSEGQIMDEKFQTKPIGFFKDAMIRLSKSSVAVISFTLIVLIILSALVLTSCQELPAAEKKQPKQYSLKEYCGG